MEVEKYTLLSIDLFARYVFDMELLSNWDSNESKYLIDNYKN